jgi:hypothetical protein
MARSLLSGHYKIASVFFKLKELQMNLEDFYSVHIQDKLFLFSGFLDLGTQLVKSLQIILFKLELVKGNQLSRITFKFLILEFFF